MNQTRSVAGCQPDVQTVRQIAFYDRRSDDRQADGWHHPESNLGDRHWYSHVTLPQTVTAGHRVIDGLRGRHGKYKTATVFLVPVTDTSTMTPFSLTDCHILPYEDVSLTLYCKKCPTCVANLQLKHVSLSYFCLFLVFVFVLCWVLVFFLFKYIKCQ